MTDYIHVNRKMHWVGRNNVRNPRHTNERDPVFAELDDLIARGKGSIPRAVFPKDREQLKALLESNKKEQV